MLCSTEKNQNEKGTRNSTKYGLKHNSNTPAQYFKAGLGRAITKNPLSV